MLTNVSDKAVAKNLRKSLGKVPMRLKNLILVEKYDEIATILELNDVVASLVVPECLDATTDDYDNL